MAEFFNEAFRFECGCNIQNRICEIKFITWSNWEVETEHNEHSKLFLELLN